MIKTVLVPVLFIFTSFLSFPQRGISDWFLSDTSLKYASVSLRIADAVTGETIAEHDSRRSLCQASVMKLITTASALQLLGHDFRFETSVGIRGTLSEGSGILKGNIIIKGGGDPCLGSERFPEYYEDFVEKWVDAIKSAGIRKVTGKVITDDSYYDFEPVPDGWIWEDIGNYYGAGVYGLSVYDNTLKLHFITSGEGTKPVMTAMEPLYTGVELTNNLVSSGNTDQGYVYLAPYTQKGWISGKVPANSEDFILKASLPDPPLFMAVTLKEALKKAGIIVNGQSSTARMSGQNNLKADKLLIKTYSPPLLLILKTINHESVNLYAEHLVKELGRRFGGSGSTDSGIKVIKAFLSRKSIDFAGMFMLDGSGLSPHNAVNARTVTELLVSMRNDPDHFDQYYSTLPRAGKEGTLKNVFREEIFDGRMRVKSGSMDRVRSYAGYITAMSGRELVFSIIINNYTGSSQDITRLISGLLREVIMSY